MIISLIYNMWQDFRILFKVQFLTSPYPTQRLSNPASAARCNILLSYFPLSQSVTVVPAFGLPFARRIPMTHIENFFPFKIVLLPSIQKFQLWFHIIWLLKVLFLVFPFSVCGCGGRADSPLLTKSQEQEGRLHTALNCQDTKWKCLPSFQL